MKNQMIVALLAAGTMVLPQPLAAAQIGASETQQPGAFGGVRIRLPLDGAHPQRRLRAELAVAPTIHRRASDGSREMRIGEGVGFGISGNDRPDMMLAGVPLSRIAQQGAEPQGRRLGISTVAWVAIGVGVALVVGSALVLDYLGDQSE